MAKLCEENDVPLVVDRDYRRAIVAADHLVMLRSDATKFRPVSAEKDLEKLYVVAPPNLGNFTKQTSDNGETNFHITDVHDVPQTQIDSSMCLCVCVFIIISLSYFQTAVTEAINCPTRSNFLSNRLQCRSCCPS